MQDLQKGRQELLAKSLYQVNSSTSMLTLLRYHAAAALALLESDISETQLGIGLCVVALLLL